MSRIILGYAYLTIAAGLVLSMAVMLRAIAIAIHMTW